jgi:hypothetical protein
VTEPSERPPRTGFEKFLFGSDEARGSGAVWWGGGGLIAFVAGVTLPFYGEWWAILLLPAAAWQFWLMKKAIARRNF